MFTAIQTKRRELEELCRRYHVGYLGLFGSALRDDFRPGESDLDFLVEFLPMAPHGHSESYFGLLAGLEKLFGCSVDLVERGALKNPYYRQEIEATQEPLYAA